MYKTNKEMCREMWVWLSENPTKNKGDYFRSEGIDDNDIPLGLCYACEACKFNCSICPISWIEDSNYTNHCKDDGSPYVSWMSSRGMLIHRPDLCEGELKKAVSIYALEIVKLIDDTWV